MTFAVPVTYLNQIYTYDCETIDGLFFICRRRPTQLAEDHGAPPEVVALEKKKEPMPYEPGAYKVQLHMDLMRGIEDFLRTGI